MPRNPGHRRPPPAQQCTFAHLKGRSGLTVRRSCSCCSSVASTEGKSNVQLQEAIFDKKADFFAKPLPQEIEKRLQSIVAAVPLSEASRVLDFGSGTGCLIPHMQAAGARDILAVDVSSGMLGKSRARHGGAAPLGNEPGVRFWHGDMAGVPAYMGGADAIFINAVFGNVVDERAVLRKCAELLVDGGRVVVSHPLGREWLRGLHESEPEMVPHELPDRAALEAMVADLPLHVVEFVDEKAMYRAVLQVPPGYALRGGPLHMQGEVVTGFQRGSRDMGVPTANVAPRQVEHHFEGRPKGVYFGWAQLQRGVVGGDRAVAPMVLNYGVRPTAKNGSHASIEAHILRKYVEDFYSADLRLLVVGYLRPEMPFPGFRELLDQINCDIGQAKAQLGKLSATDAAKAGWWT